MAGAGEPRIPTPREYPSAWAALDRGARTRIAWAVLRGRPLADREEAAMAVANAQRRRGEWLLLIARVAAVVLLTMGAVQLLAAPFAARGGVVAAVIGTINVAIGLVCMRLPALVARAERLNRDVVERPGEAPPAEPAAPASEPPAPT